MKTIQKSALSLLKIYQKHVSPKLAPRCKFYPTCSNYAIQAVEMHGAVVGMALTLWRLLRCNEFSRGGYDPVPEKKHRITRKNS